MKKYLKKELLAISDTLMKGFEEISKKTDYGKTDTERAVLEEFQECAIQMGTVIEETEGEGTLTVGYLEDLCELLYRMSLPESDAKSIRKMTKAGKRLLLKIQSSIRFDLPDAPKEIVFFPYKVSMWDSLESVWLAAKEDQDCECFVVPIPYFDKKPDGTLGTMHDEGCEYPDYVPITDWQIFDLETHRPDIAYIHNPYDGSNRVTSIHPRFYAGELKKYVDMLVYIPYFVSGNEVPEHFCVLPGTIMADRVIVESEKVRDTYIREFHKFEKENNCPGRFGIAEEKFLALGSPKFDKVLHADRENIVLPEEWKKLIERKDGTRKKVVLYNTSVQALLIYKDKAIKKIKSVLELFREKQEVVLLWRPHPLLAATVESMVPELLSEYLDMVKEYKGGGFGIYDDSVDLYRAIVVSDCYFGDVSSSLVTLYAQTGKPMVWQDVDLECSLTAELLEEYLHSDVINFGQQVFTVEEFKHKYPECYKYAWTMINAAQCSKFVPVSDYEFGTSSFLNAIYKLEEEKGNADYFASFPEEDNGAGLYHSSIRIGNRLIFAPARSRRWAFYHLETSEWTYEDIPKEFYPVHAWRAAFGGPIVYGNELIFLPGESGAIAKYNIDTGEIIYYRDWYTKLPYEVISVDWGIISAMWAYQDSLLLISPHSNIIIELDPWTISIKKTYKVGNDTGGFKTACLIPGNDLLYLLRFREPGKEPWTETIVKWNIKTGEVKELTDLPIHTIENNTQNALNGFIFWKDELFVTPLQSDSVLKIDLQTDAITRFPLSPAIDFFKRKSSYYEKWGKEQALPYVIFNAKRMKYTAQLPFDYSLADIDFSTGEISNRRKWYVEGGDQEMYRTQNISLKENIGFTLDNYLDQLGTKELAEINEEQISWCCGETRADGTAGQTIFSYIKQLVGM